MGLTEFELALVLEKIRRVTKPPLWLCRFLVVSEPTELANTLGPKQPCAPRYARQAILGGAGPGFMAPDLGPTLGGTTRIGE